MSLPYGYLLGLVVLAIPVMRFPRLPMWLGTSVFLASIAATELPFLAIAAFAAGTGLAFAQGDLSSPVAIAAAVLAAACLALTTRRGLRALPVLQRAMGATPVSRRLPWSRILLLPFAVRPRSVERIADLAYGPHGGRNLLDVYRRRSAPGGAPVLIHFHGGYYATGRKNRQSLPLIHRLAQQGWVCVSANYRLRPEAAFEGHLVDAKRVIAWVRTHGCDFGADPDRIVLSGSSAGAHLSAMAALTHDSPEFQPGFEDVDTSVSAVVGLNGWWGRYFGGAPGTSPADRAHADAPPFLIVHGGHDTLVPAAEARHCAEVLRDVSERPVVYAELPGAQHGFDVFHSPRFEAVVNAVEAFSVLSLSPLTEPRRPSACSTPPGVATAAAEGPPPPRR